MSIFKSQFHNDFSFNLFQIIKNLPTLNIKFIKFIIIKLIKNSQL